MCLFVKGATLPSFLRLGAASPCRMAKTNTSSLLCCSSSEAGSQEVAPIPAETQKRMTAAMQILEKKIARNKEQEAGKKDRRGLLERKMADLNMAPEERQKARGDLLLLLPPSLSLSPYLVFFILLSLSLLPPITPSPFLFLPPYHVFLLPPLSHRHVFFTHTPLRLCVPPLPCPRPLHALLTFPLCFMPPSIAVNRPVIPGGA